jgi:hypothetical protein
VTVQVKVSWHVLNRKAIVTEYFVIFPSHYSVTNSSAPSLTSNGYSARSLHCSPVTARLAASLLREREMIWRYSVSVSPPPSASPPPLRRSVPQRTLCLSTILLCVLWKIRHCSLFMETFQTRVFRISRLTMTAFYFVASDPCCTNSPTEIFPE